jgi:hypothetical protein
MTVSPDRSASVRDLVFEHEGVPFEVSGWPNGPDLPPVYPWGTRCITPECRRRSGYCSSCPTVGYMRALKANKQLLQSNPVVDR